MPKQTGPKTPEGKAKSSRNAVKHGLTSTRMFVLGNETPAEWDLMLKHWTEKLQPKDAAELLVVEDIAHAQWKIRRARTAECAMLDMQMDDQHDELEETYLPPVDEGCRLGYAFKTLADNSQGLNQLHRYETCARRAFKAGLAALEQLRSLLPQPDAAEEAEAELSPPPNLPPNLKPEWERLARRIPGFDPARHAHRMSGPLRQWCARNGIATNTTSEKRAA